MPIVYPPAPNTGDQFKYLGADYEYNGFGWDKQPNHILGGLKNKIINGNMARASLGTSFTSVASNAITLDRWVITQSAAAPDIDQVSLTPGESTAQHAIQIVVPANAGVNDRCIFRQRIESVTTLAGQDILFSFEAKADANKDIAVNFIQLFGAGGSAAVVDIAVTTISLTTTLTRYFVKASIPSISGKTIGSDQSDQLLVSFWLTGGSTYDVSTNTLGNQSGTFTITNVQVEKAAVRQFAPTEFEYRPVPLEQYLANYYAEVLSFNNGALVSIGQATTGSNGFADIGFSLKRVDVAASIISGGIDASNAGGVKIAIASPAFQATGRRTLQLSLNNGAGSGLVAGNATRISASGNLQIYLNAEL